MKKVILGKTILFIAILAYVIIFKTIFGEENILIAVMSITGLLMYMGRDLTGEPIKNLLGLILFYIMIGVGTFIAAHNIWIAIPVNFIIIFLISYTFGHVLKGPMYIPFSLLYLFLLAYPVPLSAMPLRIIGLVVGAISIMLPQFIINKNKLKKSSEKIFAGLFSLLLNKIQLIKDNKSTKEIDAKISSMSKTLKDIIYDKKEKKFYITDEGRINLDILVSIEKISILMEKYVNEDSEVLNDLKLFIEKLNTKDNKDTLSVYMNELKVKYNDTVDKDIIDILTSMTIITLTVENLSTHKKIEAKNIKRDLKSDIYGLKDIKFNSIKLKYSLRLAIEVVIACFIMEYFHLEQGRWIMYTVLSLTNPILEVTKSKAKDRIIATIIGAVIIGVSFSIFNNTIIRGIIVMGAGYANIYCQTYRQKMVTVTVSAIGAAALVGGSVIGDKISATPVLLSAERVLFILLGAVIAIIINSFLFKCDSNKANLKLIHASDELVGDLVRNLDVILNKKDTMDYINNVYLINSQIENTIKVNQSLNEDNNYEKYIVLSQIKQKIISNIYELQNIISSKIISDDDKKDIKDLAIRVKNRNLINENNMNLEEEYLEKETLNKRIITNLLFDTCENLRKIDEIKLKN